MIKAVGYVLEINHYRQEVDQDGVRADHHEEERPPPQFPDVNYEVKQAEKDETPAAGGQDARILAVIYTPA